MNRLLIFLFLVLAAGFVVFGGGFNLSKNSVSPVPMPTASPSQNIEVFSPDGSKKLTLKTQTRNDGSVIYSVFASDTNGRNSSLIFSKTISKGSINLPANSWSPDNKYLFIKDSEGGDVDYLVFRADGKPFTEAQKYLDATSLFKSKVKNFTLKSITGWDDPVLMSVRTTDNTHFWFAVETQSFIQLVR